MFEIGTVCFWEDDGQDDHDADEVRGGPTERCRWPWLAGITWLSGQLIQSICHTFVARPVKKHDGPNIR